MKKLFFGIFSVLIISITSQLAVAKEISVTYVAGHPPVFRWVKHVNQTFIPVSYTHLTLPTNREV